MDASNTDQPSMSPLVIYGEPRRIARVFNWITAISLASILLGGIIVLLSGDTEIALFLFVCTAPVLATFVFIKKRNFTLAALFLAIVLQLMVTLVATMGLGIHNLSNLAFPVILMIASLVANRRTMLFLTLINVGCVAWLVFGELLGLYTPDRLVRSVPGDFFSASLVIVVTAYFMRLMTDELFQSNRQLERELRERKLVEEKLEQDIALRQQAEEQIRQLNIELEQRVQERTVQLEASNREMEAFSYSVSHDLRAPLRGIDGYSRMLEEDFGPVLGTEGNLYLDNVRQAVQHMNALIDGLLKLGRITRKESSVVMVSLSKLTAQVSEALRKQDDSRQVEVSIQPNLIANGDLQLLTVAMENLLGNAWKFTRYQPQARIEFAAIENDGERIYMVRDNGVGFSMEFAGKLFQPFQRLHSLEEFEGTGIGLATVQRIIRRHGGRIWVEAAEGEGATFYFTLAEN